MTTTLSRAAIPRDPIAIACETIKQFEGYRSAAYRCPAGVWTCGYGSTGPDVGPTTVWTRQQAEDRLQRDVARFAGGVRQLVTVKATPYQIAACISLAYNIGLGNFRTSTALRKLNEGDVKGAADAFLMWNKATVDGEKTVMPGLKRRREAERGLFLTA